ncbi:nucleoprotein [Caimito virus]|uniref:Nucleoprotein n=1 Tax=Caimito virus TaxID=2572766 RepID=A0A4P8D7V0_9VIRU|nr:nucleoprotein [Caimito virus]QCI62737.1 nucleoprotein [Caimito virus]QLA46976.1 N [Caimito virus] [Caimito virus]
MDFSFETDDNTVENTFNPEELYDQFKTEMESNTNDWLKVATIFFKRMKTMKDRMKVAPIVVITAKFFDIEFTLCNTYNQNAGDQKVGDLEYTLNRLSGCMARFTFEKYEAADRTTRETIQATIKNPLAIVKGVRPDNFKLYMAFSAGTEMFMSKFSLLPLAIILRRIDTDDAPATIAGKALKQRLDSIAAIDWQKDVNVGALKDAMAVVGGVSWKHSKITEDSLNFLKKAGVSAMVLSKIKKGE